MHELDFAGRERLPRAMDFAEQEALDGLRFTWNAWPSSRVEAARLVSILRKASVLNLSLAAWLLLRKFWSCISIMLCAASRVLLPNPSLHWGVHP